MAAMQILEGMHQAMGLELGKSKHMHQAVIFFLAITEAYMSKRKTSVHELTNLSISFPCDDQTIRCDGAVQFVMEMHQAIRLESGKSQHSTNIDRSVISVNDQTP
jgi:hypothetical protein